MKNSPNFIICILICLAPTILAGQALQVQNQPLPSPLLQGTTYLHSRQMTDSPLLRLSNTGPMGEDGIKLELTSLPLLDPGPSILVDCPDPLVPMSGAIRLQPNGVGPYAKWESGLDSNEFIVFSMGPPVVAPYRPRITLRKPLVSGSQSAILIQPSEDSPYVRYTNFGTSGLRYHVGDFPADNSYFDVFYDINSGTELHSYSDPALDLFVERTYDKATPKLLERIGTTNPMMESFFDVFYDLSLGTETRLYGDPDFDLLRITSYDITTPKLSHRISSNHVDSFFDVFYDLNLATTGVGFGFDPDDLCLVHKYENNPPRLTSKVLSSNPMFSNIFLTEYKLSPLEIKTSGNDLHETIIFDYELVKFEYKHTSDKPGYTDRLHKVDVDLDTKQVKESFNDLHLTKKFDTATPKLAMHLASDNPMFAGKFFDIEYSLAGSGGGAGKTAYQDIFISHVFDPATPRLLQHIASSNPMFSDKFFDIEYTLAGSGGGTGKASFQDLHFMNIYTPATPSLLQRIASSNPLYEDSFFDILYDLQIGRIEIEHSAMIHREQYNESEWDFITTLSSSEPAIPSFFDITYDISLADLQRHWIRAGVTGEPPLEMRYEYDALDRKIKKIGTDYQSGSFFDITYDLDLQKQTMEWNNLVCTRIYSDGTRHDMTFTSSDPGIPSFFDITYDIGLPDLQKHIVRAGGAGMAPLEMRYEYDASSRIIKEICTDVESGSFVTFERRFVPSESFFRLGNRLEMATGKSIKSQSGPLLLASDLDVTGTISSSSGPFAVVDNVTIDGTLDVIGTISSASGPVVFSDNVQINGSLTVTPGPKLFKIDHPLDPDNKYLIHSCIESPEMMNIYNGNTITDAEGYATILLPDYFEALNSDYRYQLTCMGQFAQSMVDKKIMNNQFVIKTDKPNVEVSWQVTGIRHDPGSNRRDFMVEVEKEPEMKGKRLYQPQ